MTGVGHLPVVAGVDGSPESQAAARWAADEAQRRKAPLRLLHAYTIPMVGFPGYPAPADLRDVLRRAGTDILDRATAELRSVHPNLLIDTVLEHADPRRALVLAAEKAALLVIGAHGNGRVPGVMLGSVAVSVAAHSSTPVVVVPPRSESTAPEGLRGPVLVGVDASHSAEAAIAVAFEEAACHGTDLIALLAWQPTTRAMIADDSRAITAQEADAGSMLAEQLAGWPEKYPDVALSQELVQGWPADTILQFGHSLPPERQPRLIVVGSHGHGRLASLFLSSTGQALISAAPWPVMTAPSPRR